MNLDSIHELAITYDINRAFTRIWARVDVTHEEQQVALHSLLTDPRRTDFPKCYCTKCKEGV